MLTRNHFWNLLNRYYYSGFNTLAAYSNGVISLVHANGDERIVRVFDLHRYKGPMTPPLAREMEQLNIWLGKWLVRFAQPGDIDIENAGALNKRAQALLEALRWMLRVENPRMRNGQDVDAQLAPLAALMPCTADGRDLVRAMACLKQEVLDNIEDWTN